MVKSFPLQLSIGFVKNMLMDKDPAVLGRAEMAVEGGLVVEALLAFSANVCFLCDVGSEVGSQEIQPMTMPFGSVIRALKGFLCQACYLKCTEHQNVKIQPD
jgi:hypothetical protein